ncbi:NAD-dependent epimerase/dehydratase family protein [Paenibacillus senegalimassiliensis]|uniref:NAD-dependent epimerase/dehydratase family protein n=1 Tax=Paenibacillus senegalimassiliensis TaxID=1737426 RepID=UPI00073EFE1E|nr:NAD-dependent epimerase/dehydratase family protein [Paenibacillus senegalimassiliensis]
MKVLVTGGAGFIGGETVKRIREQDEQVVIVDNGDMREGSHKPEGDKEVAYYAVDVASKELEDVFAQERPDRVIHLAAQTSVRRSLNHPVEDAQTNILGTVNVLEQCVRYGVQKIVFASSAAVYGNPVHLPIAESHAAEPLSFYGMSKWAGERYIQAFGERYGLGYAILRYANVYGIRERRTGEDGVLTAFVERLLAGLPLDIFGDGRQTRDFIYVKDVADATVHALRTNQNQVLNIGSSTGTSLLEVVDLLKELSGRQLQPQFHPASSGDIGHSILDNGKARDALWWEPRYTLYEGLREMVEFEMEVRKNPLLVERLAYSEASTSVI